MYIEIICIYKISSLIKPEKFYIGSSVNFTRRRNCHFNHLKKNKHSNSKLQNHYNKYGKEDLIMEPIEILSNKEMLVEKEQYYIDTLKPIFNIALNVEQPNIGKIASKETREKMSLSKKGKRTGPFTEEHKKNLSLAKKGKQSSLGRVLSQETKDKISATLKSNNLKGKKQSEQHIKNRSESMKRKVIDINTNILYNSVTEAADAFKVSLSVIVNAIKGKTKNRTNLQYYT